MSASWVRQTKTSLRIGIAMFSETALTVAAGVSRALPKGDLSSKLSPPRPRCSASACFVCFDTRLAIYSPLLADALSPPRVCRLLVLPHVQRDVRLHVNTCCVSFLMWHGCGVLSLSARTRSGTFRTLRPRGTVPMKSRNIVLTDSGSLYIYAKREDVADV